MGEEAEVDLSLEAQPTCSAAARVEEADEVAERLCQRIAGVHDDIMADLLAAEAAEAARLEREEAAGVAGQRP